MNDPYPPKILVVLDQLEPNSLRSAILVGVQNGMPVYDIALSRVVGDCLATDTNRALNLIEKAVGS